MARNNYFQFKKFKIVQEKSAMKVGTDGVLLGAWVDVCTAENILDIGTGTGLIALMLAQRTKARITAIEIEKYASEEAILNVSNSSWKEHIKVINISFQEFVHKNDQKFDLIVSNPPFFSNGVKKKDPNQTIARHTDTLNFTELIQGSIGMLNDDGILAVILPQSSREEFNSIAVKSGLNLLRELQVQPKTGKPVNRCLLEFSKTKRKMPVSGLAIYNEDGHDYTEPYKNLTRDFYLNF